jgi:hypothetical protein
VVKATLTLDISPAVAGTKVTVDKVEVTGGTTVVELPGGKKKVRVVVKASGYRTFDEDVTLTGDHTLTVKLKKRSSGGGGGGGGTGTGTGGGGIIDL